jgi:hypothetical protein
MFQGTLSTSRYHAWTVLRVYDAKVMASNTILTMSTRTIWINH